MLVAPAEFISQDAAPALAALVVAHTLGPPGSIARIPGTAAAPVPLPEVA